MASLKGPYSPERKKERKKERATERDFVRDFVSGADILRSRLFAHVCVGSDFLSLSNAGKSNCGRRF